MEHENGFPPIADVETTETSPERHYLYGIGWTGLSLGSIVGLNEVLFEIEHLPVWLRTSSSLVLAASSILCVSNAVRNFRAGSNS